MSSPSRSSNSKSALTPSSPAQKESLHLCKREQKGERRQRRHEKTKLRRASQAEQIERYARPPETAVEAAARWDAFYLTKSALYKDRHLLRSQLLDAVSPSVAADPSVHVPPLNAQTPSDPHIQDTLLVEVGCGAGASVYPLLRANPRLHIIAFDISEQAILSLRRSPEYSPHRVTAFVADVSRSESFLPALFNVQPLGANFVTAVWTLSALPCHSQLRAAKALASALAPGGTLYIRDYAHGDMREHRFAEAGRRVNSAVDTDGVSEESRLFLRGDGTYAYFFTTEEIRTMLTVHGLHCVSCVYEERTVHNRKLNTSMRRRWVVGHFQKRRICELRNPARVEDCDLSMHKVLNGIHGAQDL